MKATVRARHDDIWLPEGTSEMNQELSTGVSSVLHPFNVRPKLVFRSWSLMQKREIESLIRRSAVLPFFLLLSSALSSRSVSAEGEVVTFPSGELTLHGVLYKPNGTGPFPAVVYNHGSAPGMLSKEAFDTLGPVFVKNGWVFFGPYRRGQGLSASAGKYIGDEIAAATKERGVASGAATMVRLLETDHLNDQLAALAWLRTQKFVKPDRIAVAGNSFGGIEAVLGAERTSYCPAIDSAGRA